MPHLSSGAASAAPTRFADGGRDVLLQTADVAAISAADWLRQRQHEAGYWCGELQGDTILESEYILLLAWLGEEQSATARKAAQYLLEQQSPMGGWAQFPGGAADVNVSVKAYFALKLTGHDPQSNYMQRARGAIVAAGGADRVNSFTRFYLALLGQISYDHCPAVPPELVLLPRRSPINIYRMSAWTRTILVPLSIMWAHRPARELPQEQGIGELFIEAPDRWPALRSPGLAPEHGWLTWDRLFRNIDAALKWCERRGVKPLRAMALKEAERWMTLRFGGSDGLGAIIPPIIWSLVALKCLGYDNHSAEVCYCREQLDALSIEQWPRGADQPASIRLQPCKSPVWDTALSLRALDAAGVAPVDAAIGKAVDWLLDKEVTRRGDWAQYVDAEPAGWFFEHHNDFYPDVDDTVMVMMALRRQFAASETGESAGVEGQGSGEEKDAAGRAASLIACGHAPDEEHARRYIDRLDRAAEACERARRWILAMQNRDGGWGAFDKDNNFEILCRVPFADHNAMIDPSTPDITARVLEALAHWGMRQGDPDIDRAITFVRRTQESDGSWFGRWGVNYIYGTWQALVGLTEIGVPTDDPAVTRGADWLLRYQQPCGGWGESPHSYADPAQCGQGAPTASQTAWALLGLIAAGRAEDPAVRRGVQWLVDTQRGDGGWDEPEFTGTGFPQVFYLRYHYYPIYFPLLAISHWRAAQRAQTTGSSTLNAA